MGSNDKNFSSTPDGSILVLETKCTRFGSTADEKLEAIHPKVVHFEARLAQILALTRWMSRMDSHVTSTFGGFAARLTEMEQNFSALTARMCKIETNAASASGVAGSARSWPSPGQVDGSTVARHHDPGSSEEGRNTRRRLGKDTSPDDESAPSAVLSRFLCEQCHAGVSAWLKKTLVPTDLPEGIHCKAGTTSARLVFETRARCQEFVARFKDDGLPCSVCSPFCNTPRARFLFVHLDHHNGERSVDGLHRSGKFVATKLREIFPEHDIEGTDIVPAIDFRAQFINMFDRRYGSEDTNRCLA